MQCSYLVDNARDSQFRFPFFAFNFETWDLQLVTFLNPCGQDLRPRCYRICITYEGTARRAPYGSTNAGRLRVAPAKSFMFFLP